MMQCNPWLIIFILITVFLFPFLLYSCSRFCCTPIPIFTVFLVPGNNCVGKPPQRRERLCVHAASQRTHRSTSTERKCSPSHPSVERSGHSVACATSGLLRSTLPPGSAHRQHRKPFPVPAPPPPRRERMAMPGLSFHCIPRCVPFQIPQYAIMASERVRSFLSVPEMRRHFTHSLASAPFRPSCCGSAPCSQGNFARSVPWLHAAYPPFSNHCPLLKHLPGSGYASTAERAALRSRCSAAGTTVNINGTEMFRLASLR